MKSERRHELQHNVLADWLGKQVEVIKPYTNYILGAVIAVCAVAIIAQIVITSKSGTSGKAWSEFDKAMTISDVDKRLAALEPLEKGANSTWVYLAEADTLLEQAISKVYNEPDKAKEFAKSAKEKYSQVIESRGRAPLLQQRALYGLAQTNETLGEFDEARKNYSRLAKESADSVFAKSATRRLKHLESTDVKDFYNQLAAFKPPKTKSPETGLEGIPGLHPGLGGPGGLGGLGGSGFGAPLPERPDLTLPGPSFDFPSLDGPAKTPSKVEDPDKKVDGDAPVDLEKKPDGDKPADPDKTPADPEKKPDGEKPADPEKKPVEPEKKPDGDKTAEPEKTKEVAPPAETEKKSAAPEKKIAKPEPKKEGKK